MNGNLKKSTVVKEYDFNKPDVNEIDYLLDDIIENCRKKNFRSFEFKLVYDIKLTNNSNNEKVNFTITHRSMENKTEFYGLNKNIKNARGNGFIFSQINQLTIKIYSNLSNTNIRYYLKIRIPKMHRHFFRLLSQN